MKALSYQEFKELAYKLYTKGGADYYECWDASNFDDYVKEFGAITRATALKWFRRDYENYKISKRW